MLFTDGSIKIHTYIRNDASSLIFFVFWDRKRPPAGREDRNARLWIVRQLYSCLFY